MGVAVRRSSTCKLRRQIVGDDAEIFTFKKLVALARRSRPNEPYKNRFESEAYLEESSNTSRLRREQEQAI